MNEAAVLENLYFQWYILNVDKIYVVAYISLNLVSIMFYE